VLTTLAGLLEIALNFLTASKDIEMIAEGLPISLLLKKNTKIEIHTLMIDYSMNTYSGHDLLGNYVFVNCTEVVSITIHTPELEEIEV
jgi:hypothetical protein